MSRPRNLAEAARREDGPLSVSTKRRRMAEEIAQAGQRETPYGVVVKPLDLGVVSVPCICPHALLWVMCGLSVE